MDLLLFSATNSNDKTIHPGCKINGMPYGQLRSDYSNRQYTTISFAVDDPRLTATVHKVIHSTEGDSFDCCTERYEIAVLFLNSAHTKVNNF